MEMRIVAVSETFGARIIQKLLKDTGLRKMCHLGKYRICQGFAAILPAYIKCLTS
jgi:hypothetical protein